MNKSLKFVSLLGGIACLTISASAQSSQDPAITDTPPPSSQSAIATPQASDQPNANASNANDAANSRFTAIDKDNDGRISRSEFTLSSPQLQTGDATMKDADKAEKASTADELSTGSGSNSVELFNQLDTDKDSFLTQAELVAQPKITN